MNAVFLNRAAIEAKYPELVSMLLELVKAINTPPIYVGDAAERSGTGSPENVVTGNVGDTYRRRDGSTSTTFYVKETGTNTKTGWIAK